MSKIKSLNTVLKFDANASHRYNPYKVLFCLIIHMKSTIKLLV